MFFFGRISKVATSRWPPKFRGKPRPWMSCSRWWGICRSIRVEFAALSQSSLYLLIIYYYYYYYYYHYYYYYYYYHHYYYYYYYHYYYYLYTLILYIYIDWYTYMTYDCRYIPSQATGPFHDEASIVQIPNLPPLSGVDRITTLGSSTTKTGTVAILVPQWWHIYIYTYIYIYRSIYIQNYIYIHILYIYT